MCLKLFRKTGMSEQMISQMTENPGNNFEGIDDAVQFLAEWARSEHDRKELEKDMPKQKAPVRRKWDRCMV
jgi:hypothetical protein